MATERQAQALFSEVKEILKEQPYISSKFKGVKWTGKPVKGCQGVAADLDAYNQVYQSIYIGNGPVARDPLKLCGLGVTHVLNAAYGNRFSQVDTSADIYLPHSIAFLGVPAMDQARYNISQHFREAVEFIDNGIKSGGKVYVHCHYGRSRSATLVLAYLMMNCGLRLAAAMRILRRRRAVRPNDAFIRQLCALDVQLHSQKTIVVERVKLPAAKTKMEKPKKNFTAWR